MTKLRRMPSYTTREVIQTLVDLYKTDDGPFYILMVGAPGHGKSTFAKALGEALPLIVCNTDDWLEARAKRLKIQVHEAHTGAPFGQITTLLARKIWENLNYGKNVLVDQTSVTALSRAKKLKLCQTSHLKICIDLFDETSAQDLANRVKERHAKGGRFVPLRVIEEMLKAYEPPRHEEGFALVFQNVRN